MKKKLILIYQLFIFAPIFILATIITATVVMIGCWLGNPMFWGYYPPHYWSKLTCRLALCSITVKREVDLDYRQSYIFIPNHQSAFDIFLIYGYLNHHIKWVQKQELRKIPFVGRASEIAGHVFVNQSNPKLMKEAITEVEEQLKAGGSICMFPEGSRTAGGKMGRFKRGAFIIAKEMNLPIVPITINGAFDVMKMTTYLITPGKLELIIHKPITIDHLQEDDIPQFITKCHAIIHDDLWEKNK